MKRALYPLPFFVLSLFLFCTSQYLQGQTISTDPLPESDYCVGDAIEVGFTVTGGGLNPGNAFIVQLSDPAGSFNSAEKRILGSADGTGSGSISVTLPSDLEAGSSYRIRVVASNPVTPGSDNGSDIGIYDLPYVRIEPDFPLITFTGVPLQLVHRGERNLRSYHWYFGGNSTPDASFQQTPPPVVYASPGKRTIELTGVAENPAGCSSEATHPVMVHAANPGIPSEVTIVSGELRVDRFRTETSRKYWVCPGGKLTISDNYSFDPFGSLEQILIVYVEFGGVVDFGDLGGQGVIYAKDGAEIRNPRHGNFIAVLAEEGATLAENNSWLVYRTPSITFDYSQVPPNGCPSLAPYTVQVDPDSRSIHSEESEEGSGQNYFLNPGATLTSTGDDNTYLVQSGGSLVVRGSNSLIYLKDGASLDVLEGSGHRIFYEQKAVIESPGADPILLPSSGITFVGQVSSVEGEDIPVPDHLDIE